jgi:hypothetical protein
MVVQQVDLFSISFEFHLLIVSIYQHKKRKSSFSAIHHLAKAKGFLAEIL